MINHWNTNVLLPLNTKKLKKVKSYLTYHLWNNISFSHIKMFNLSQKYAADRPILKCEYIIYTPPSLNLVNGENNQVFIDIPREYSAFSLRDAYPEVDFNVKHRAGAQA